MKTTLLLSVVVLTALAGGTAQAQYSLTKKHTGIKCRGPGAIMTIDADRKIISYFNYGDEGYGMTYDVSQETSDNHSYVTYASTDSQVTLHFGLKNDSVQFGDDGQIIPLKCFALPQ